MNVRLEEIDTLAQARPTWDELAEASGNVFSTWDWADTRWRHLGAGRRLMLRNTRTEDGRVAATLPHGFRFARREVYYQARSRSGLR